MNAMYYQREMCRLLKKTSNEPDQASAPPRPSSALTQDENKNVERMNLDNNLTTEEHKPNNFETMNHNLPSITEGCSDELSTKAKNLCQIDEDFNLPVTQSTKPKPSSNAELLSNSLSTNDKETQKIKNNLRFAYSIWTFGHLNLLVRVTNCGLLYQRNKEGKGSLHPVNVFAKPEYQLMFGYEQITSSEASRWWIDSYLNPDSFCACARVNPVSSELLRVDVLSNAAIINMSLFNPTQPMKMVHNILNRLEKLLNPGSYILSHLSGDMHMCIYELLNEEEGAVEGKKASYDLHASHSQNNEFLVYYEKFIPWVPIDQNLFQEWHIAHERIPKNFPAVSSEELAKKQQANTSAGKKKKKGKKNKKKNATGKKTDKVPTKERGFENYAVSPKPSNIYRKRLRSGDWLTDENPEDDFKSDENYVTTETAIALRLRSRSNPVTYDDLEFDF